MTHPISTIRRCLLTLATLALFAVPGSALAQLDTTHWLPANWASRINHTGSMYLALSTPELSAVNYTVENASGLVVATGTVSNASPVVLNLGTAPAPRTWWRI